MRKLIALLAILMLVSVPAFTCYEEYCESEEPSVTNITNINNELMDRDNPGGLGLDIVVYESDIWWAEQVTVEARFDLENEEEAVFFVTKINAHKFISSLIGGE